jgi:hypothetical protein
MQYTIAPHLKEIIQIFVIGKIDLIGEVQFKKKTDVKNENDDLIFLYTLKLVKDTIC